MKNKLMILPFMIILASLMVLGATMQSPTASSTIEGTGYLMNVTVDNDNTENCTITLTSTLSGDSLATVLTNSSDDAAFLNGTFDTESLEDAADYAVTGTCYNTSGASETVTGITLVQVDNTIPTAPTSMLPTSSSDKRNIALSASVGAAVTTICTATISAPHHTETYSMTHTGTSCTATIDLPGGGEYQYYITASDGLNTTSNTAVNLHVSEDGSGAAYAGPASTTSSNNNNKTLGTLALLGIAIVVFATQGGSTTKRKRSKRSKRRR